MTPTNTAPGASNFNPGLILLALAPVFLLTIGAEAWYRRGHDPSVYSFKDTVSNARLVLTHQISDAFFLWLMIEMVYSWTYNHGLRIVPKAWWSFVLPLPLRDSLYHFSHRAGHRVRWTWILHMTHHSSEDMDFSTAFRQSPTYPISGMWLFWTPPAWVGSMPDWVILVAGLNLAFQFFVYTRLGALDSRYAGFWRWLG